MTLSRFGDLVHLNTDRIPDPLAAGIERYVGLEHIEPENLHIRSWGNVADGITFTNHFKPGQVLFGKRRAYQRKVAVAEFEGVCSSDIYVFESKDPDVLLPELLPFICQSEGFYQYAVTTSAGSLSPRTNWTHLANYEFPLPPVDEQRRIANLLWAADDMVGKKQILLDKLRILRQSLINDIIPEPSENPEITCSLENVCEMQNGKGFPSEEYTTQGIRLLRPGNLGSNGYFDWNSNATKYLSEKFSEIASAYLINSGDVVMNLTAQSLEEGFIGRVCLARDGDVSLLNQRIGRFKCNSDIKPEYLYRCFQTFRFRQTAESRCEGSKIKHMYWHHIADFKIVVPELKVQDEIIEKCKAVDNTIFSAEIDVEKSSELKKKLLASQIGLASCSTNKTPSKPRPTQENYPPAS